MKKIVLLRHGETSVTGKYIGSTDLALSKNGIQQISKAAEKLSTLNFDKIYCSPLKRCMSTSDILLTGTEANIDPRIREIDFGEWENLSFNEIKTLYVKEVSEWSRNSESFTFPGGENVENFRSRIVSFSETLSTDLWQNILVITHGGVIRHLICIMLNLPTHNYLYFKVNYGKYAVIDLFDEGGVLTALNW